MRHIIQIIGLAAATAMAAGSPAAAVQMHGAAKPSGNIVGAVSSSQQHKTLAAAVRAAGLVDTLASGGPFTVFAPTDAAFAKLPNGTLDTLLKPANRDQLAAILTYHVVPGSVSSTELVEMIQDNDGSVSLDTVQGTSLTASISDGKVVLTDANGGTATVTNADLMQSNGVIHITESVSLPK